MGDEEDDDEEGDDARALIWLRERHGIAPGTPPRRGRIDLGAVARARGHARNLRADQAPEWVSGMLPGAEAVRLWTPVAALLLRLDPTQAWRASARFRTERPARVPSNAVFNNFDEADRPFALS